MKKEYLTDELGISEKVALKIIEQHESEINPLLEENSTLKGENETLKEEAETTKKNFEKENKKLTDELSGMKYDAACEKVLAGIEFSSGLARNAAKQMLIEKALVLSDNGELEGALDFVEELKAQHQDAFAQKRATPEIVTGSGTKAEVTKEEFEKMGYSERVKFFRESPEEYNKFIENNNK